MVSDRTRDVALGLSVSSWAVLGALHAVQAEGVSLVRLTLVCLNGVVGVLFLARSPAVRQPSVWALAICVPSMAIAGLALRLAPTPTAWPTHAKALFAAGGLAAIVALACLGRSFAMFPAVRGIVVRGPFRLIRHPVYACELAMILACGLAIGPGAAVGLTAVATALVVVRILAEERLLETAPVYREYASRVHWRLVPGIW